MGTAALILGIFGLCISWLPGVGWLGVAAGLAACAIGVPSITHWFRRPGHTGWGAASIMTGSVAASVGFAYQVKHAQGALDFLVQSLPAPEAYLALAGALVVVAAGLVVARRKGRRFGVAIAAVGILALVVAGGWSLTTADRALLGRGEPVDSAHAAQKS